MKKKSENIAWGKCRVGKRKIWWKNMKDIAPRQDNQRRTGVAKSEKFEEWNIEVRQSQRSWNDQSILLLSSSLLALCRSQEWESWWWPKLWQLGNLKAMGIKEEESLQCIFAIFYRLTTTPTSFLHNYSPLYTGITGHIIKSKPIQAKKHFQSYFGGF